MKLTWRRQGCAFRADIGAGEGVVVAPRANGTGWQAAGYGVQFVGTWLTAADAKKFCRTMAAMRIAERAGKDALRAAVETR